MNFPKQIYVANFFCGYIVSQVCKQNMNNLLYFCKTAQTFAFICVQNTQATNLHSFFALFVAFCTKAFLQKQIAKIPRSANNGGNNEDYKSLDKSSVAHGVTAHSGDYY